MRLHLEGMLALTWLALIPMLAAVALQADARQEIVRGFRTLYFMGTLQMRRRGYND